MTVTAGLLTEVFRANRMLVYVVYGQVFLLMGVAIAMQSMKHTRLTLGKHLWLLAVFGITHGFTEWGHAFIPVQAAYLSSRWITTLQVFQFVLLFGSFLFLLAFACRLLLDPADRQLSALAAFLFGSTALVLTLTTYLPARTAAVEEVLLSGEIWVRYLVGFPAALGTGIALHRQARQVEAQALPRIARWLRAAGWSFGAYAFLTGLVTPTHQLFLAPWVNQATFEELLGVPLPLLRSVPAAVVAVNIVRSLHVFQIETDRMLAEAKQQKLLVAERELAVMSEIAVTLGATREPGKVLAEVLRRILDLLKLQGGRAALLAHPGAEVLARIGSDPTDVEAGDLERLARAAAEGTGVVDLPLSGGARGIGIPVIAAQRVIGVLAISGTGAVNLSEQERQCLVSIGNQIGVALENARLWREVQRKEAMRSELLSRVIDAQEEERIRVARELHDEVGQALSGLAIRVGAALEALPPAAGRARRILEGNRELLTQSIHELRNLILRLRPAALDDLGLVPALRRFGRRLGQDSGFRFSLHAARPAKGLPKAIETVLFRIVQEALTNAAKHAHATEVTVRVEVEQDQVQATVIDNGRGFDVAGALDPAHGPGFGLLGMQERATLVGGTVEIQSRAGQGTRLVVRIPLLGDAARDGERDSGSAG